MIYYASVGSFFVQSEGFYDYINCTRLGPIRFICVTWIVSTIDSAGFSVSLPPGLSL